ncbi:MAG: 1-deoxy-D-xylulose-5-phosphate reductoisomerase [Firmicutes bacterium]|nr:1-deoxy-D-xylulose-5-phosphate reductoisomerase [Bacillota bacterium]
MKRISIIGSTGSVGKQALQVIAALKDHFEIIALACGSNVKLLKQQAKKFKPRYTCVGEGELFKIANDRDNDMILFASSGVSALEPLLLAIENGIDIALANKEVLVIAGEIIMKKAREHKVNIIPVDSEHSAIHQCLQNGRAENISKLILTASGGPFLRTDKKVMDNATAEHALAHPRWIMGKKISVDSATMMNKGFEVIEAHHLFGVPYENIEVVIHPQSIVHSMVEFVDGSVIAQLGVPSMHIPIQYALTYPERVQGIKSNSFNITDIARLDFEKPDFKKFPCLALAIKAGKQGGDAPARLNAANDKAVQDFLDGKIKFGDIYKMVSN